MEKNINGMVNQMNRITASFSGYKMIAIICVVCLFVCCLGGFYLYTTQMSQNSSTIYVLNNGEVLSASRQDQSITRKDEVKDHVMRFHEYFFNIPPDKQMIKRNLEAALELTSGKSVYNYYNDLVESGYYSRLVSNNAFQQIEVESVSVDMSTYPYTVIWKGSQYVTRQSNITKFTLVTTCRISNAIRTDKNLHGLVIEDFKVIENKHVETKNR